MSAIRNEVAVFARIRRVAGRWSSAFWRMPLRYEESGPALVIGILAHAATSSLPYSPEYGE